MPDACPSMSVTESAENLAEEQEGGSDVTILETLCMNCYKNGQTRLYLTSIPNFRDVIVASFECPHCKYSNREVQNSSALAETGGCRITLSVQTLKDLNRQIIKAEHATVFIPELELEIPPTTQRGVCSTVEGILREAIAGLQRTEATLSDEIARLSQRTIEQLELYASGTKLPFTFVLEDPAGHSFIEPYATAVAGHDPQLVTTHFERTLKQLHDMGYYGAEESPDAEGVETESKQTLQSRTVADSHSAHIDTKQLPNQLRLAGWDLGLSVEENVARLSANSKCAMARDEKPFGSSAERDDDLALRFDVICPHCGKNGSNEMCQIMIPGFRQCLIMAFVCAYCGSRSNEVKPMGAYGAKAKRWTLSVTSTDDLNRDVLKSDTAGIRIPSLDFEMCTGTLGGIFTTVEGLLLKIVENLSNSCSLFAGDSASPEKRVAFQSLLDRLTALASDPKALPFTFILDDPADLSMISGRNPLHKLNYHCEDAEPLLPENDGSQATEDFNLVVEAYERTEEQDDDLGISTMCVENYTSDEE